MTLDDPKLHLKRIDSYPVTSGRKDIAPDAPLFVGFERGDHATVERVSDKMLERLVKQAELLIGINLSPHCLQAGFIALTSEGGVHLEQVQYASRHVVPRTTQHCRKRKLNLDDNAVGYLKL